MILRKKEREREIVDRERYNHWKKEWIREIERERQIRKDR